MRIKTENEDGNVNQNDDDEEEDGDCLRRWWWWWWWWELWWGEMGSLQWSDNTSRELCTVWPSHFHLIIIITMMILITMMHFVILMMIADHNQISRREKLHTFSLQNSGLLHFFAFFNFPSGANVPCVTLSGKLRKSFAINIWTEQQTTKQDASKQTLVPRMKLAFWFELCYIQMLIKI